MDRKIDSYKLGLYEKSMPPNLSWMDKLSLAKTVGFDYIELSIDETDKKLSRLRNDQEIKEIRSSIVKVGIPIKSICLSAHRKYSLGSSDDAVRERGLQIFYDAIDMASALGIRTIQLAGYDVFYEEGTKETELRFLEYLKKGIEYASSQQIVCGFETMETEFMNTVRKSMNYVKEINSPYLQIYPDLGNLTNASKTKNELYEDIKSGKGHIVAAHLKETLPNVFREVLFTEGHVDFDEGIQALWNQGVRSFVCECWYTNPKSYKEELIFNCNFLRNKIEKVSRKLL